MTQTFQPDDTGGIPLVRLPAHLQSSGSLWSASADERLKQSSDNRGTIDPWLMELACGVESGWLWKSDALVSGRADVSSHVEDTLTWLELVGIHVNQLAKVREYFAANLDLVDLLPCICDAVASEFGSGAVLCLNLYEDPEFNSRYLTLYVRQYRYDDDLIERIDGAIATFVPALATRSGRLLVTSDFRTP
jgi:hypothetical protein